jgi:hypothetical protein
MLKKSIFPGLLALALLWSCEEATFDPVVELGAAPVIESPSAVNTFVLTEENADQVMTTITWTAADFGFPAGITYTVEFDAASGDFTDAITIGQAAGTNLKLDVTNQRMNDLMLANGYPFDVAADLKIRIAASVSNDVEKLYSAPVGITVTPFEQVINYPKLYVPGSHQGWDPASAPNIYSTKSDNNYEGYVYFADPNTEFKYTEGPNWDVNWGDTGADGTLDSNGDNLLSPDAGVHKLNVNLTNMTHTFVKTDWGLIGDATPGGWDNDTNMTYDPATGVWSITLDLNDGFIKFRANDLWDINFGDNEGDFIPEYGGENIPVTAGNYTIELMLERAPYLYKVTEN